MKGSRKFLMLLAGAGFIASLSAWVGIKIGRPLYYSDGQEAVAAFALADSGMLRWGAPEARFQLPGKVRGRVTELPDGRWIYGQPADENRTDLVVYDPRNPGQPPQPVIELNSEGHELAPVLGPGGSVYFASDRASGAGGFDLYSASYREGIFFGVRRLPDGINTGLDESDPAVDRVGGQLAFVRRDPELEDGRNGQLMLASLDDPESARPIFDPEKETGARRLKLPPIDRDPAFAPDGLGIYFVRERLGEKPALLRTFWHEDHYVPPMAVRAIAASGATFRGPALTDGGFGMRLVSVAEPAVIYRSRAEEVYPYWEGQWWLEWLLLSAVVFFALLVVLLMLGARWHQLDMITKLLLLSMLIHLLLLLWMSRMEITRKFAPDKPGTGDVEVHIVAASANSGETGSTEVRQNVTDLSRSMQFQGHEEALASGDPGTEVAQVRGEREASEMSRPSYNPTQTARNASVADAAQSFAVRAARAKEFQHARQELATEADTSARPEAQHREQQPGRIVVAVPSSEQSLASELAESRSSSEVAPDASWALPTPRAAKRSDVAVGDAPAQPEVRAAKAAPAQAKILANPRATRAVAAAAQPVQSPSRAEQDVGTVAPVPRAQPTEQPIAAAPARRVTSAITESNPLQARPTQSAAPELRDTVAEAAPSRAKRSAGASASKALTRAATSTEQAPAPAVTAFAPQRSAPGKMSAALPTSDLEQTRVARAEPGVSRSLPTARDLSASAVDLVADLPTAGVATSQKTATSSPAAAVAAAELSQVKSQRESRTEAPVRSSASVSELPPSRIDPGSMFERQRRRVVADATAGQDAVQARQMDPLTLDLNDSVTPSDLAEPSAPVSRAERSEQSKRLQPALAQIRPDEERVGVEPRRPWRPDAGLRDRDFGVRAPSSFVARAVRAVVLPEKPVEIAKLTPYANRFGANKQAALKKYGGDAATERAVQKGLAYLAGIQNRDGTWGNRRRSQRKYGQVFIGKTGLCLLAFLGAGHTPDSGTEYSEVTRRAIDALLETQIRGTHFGRSSSYSHGITTYALAECYALTKDARIRRPLQRAVDWILANQNLGRDRRNHGGWGYFSSTLRAEDRYSRSSTTAWQVMALESARLSGIEIPEAALNASRAYLLNNYDRRYRYFLYNKEPNRLRSDWRTLPASTPAAVFCLQLFGMDPKQDNRLAAGLEYTLDRKPTRYRRFSDDDFVLRGAGNVYFWYYGSLACFLAGGDAWKRWNSALKRVLIDGQSRDGSFRPIDTYAEYAGDTDDDRSYTTSMCVLSLEVYYRYFTPLLKKK